MKIAVWHNLPSGGAKRALHGHVVGLVARGHRVEAWCPQTADDKYLSLANHVTEHRLPFHLPPPPRSLLDRLALRLRPDPLLEEMNRHSQACADVILSGDFDLVYAAPCSFYGVPRLAHFLAGRGLPVCLYLQEPFRYHYEAMPELPWLAPLSASGLSMPGRVRRWTLDQQHIHRLRRAGRREFEDAKRYDLMLVNSYFSRESVARAYGLDSRVCYLGYDDAIFRREEPSPPRERFVIGLGSLVKTKGVETSLRAMACLPTPRPPLVWVANSESPAYRREMEELARQTDVDLQVRSRIDDGALAALLNRASLLLYTSHLEPFGYAPIEANACGAPVVAVAEGGIRETVTDGVNGFLCDRDPEALAGAMNRLLADPILAAEKGAAGERMARERWSLEPSLSRLEHHFYRLLAAKKSL